MLDLFASTTRTDALARSSSAQIPLHPNVGVPRHVIPVSQIRAFDVEYGAIADRLDEVCGFLSELFLN